jgi:hypothetical protein
VGCRYSKMSFLVQIKFITEHTHELQFLIKTKDSIFNRKMYTTDERRIPSVAWLRFEKFKHLSEMSDRVSRKCFKSASPRGLSRKFS